MNSPISQKKGWVFTRDAFDRMLAELHPDSEQAGEQYEKIRRKLVKLFEWRGCLDAEACADETFNRVAQKISEGASIWTNDPYSYFHGVALNVWREYRRTAEQTANTLKEVAQIQDFLVDPEDLLLQETKERERERQLECLNRCLQNLPPESIYLITKYHHGDEAPDKARRKELAQSLGIPLNALRIRAYRIRAAIVECVKNCLERGPAG
jgi:DNA-directed RNA polymerase specialized sigma24 family protein